MVKYTTVFVLKQIKLSYFYNFYLRKYFFVYYLLRPIKILMRIIVIPKLSWRHVSRAIR